MKKYAYIKDNVVQDVLAFEDDASSELLQDILRAENKIFLI